MNDAPAAFDLLQLATAHLRERVAPNLDADTRYNILLAARASEIAWRDRSLDAARDEAERAVVRMIASEDITAAIRSGARDSDAALHGALLAMTAIATFPTRPDILTDSERAEIDKLLR